MMTAGAVAVFLWKFGPHLEQGAADPRGLAEAQTLAVTTVILFQVFYLQKSRSLRDPVWRIGWLSNPTVYLGVGIILLAQACFIYLAPLQAVFGSAPLEWTE
jgi:magnesium-transporting ATPase (P-type)